MHIPVGVTLGKSWGTTQSIFSFNNIEVNRLNILAHGYCSEHYHQCKFSRLFVLYGKLRVTIINDNSINDEIVLTGGMCTDIPPGVWHKFEALEDSDVIEIYWVLLDDNDIERRTTGGIAD